MLRLRYLALLAAVGCSPVKDSSNVPDATIDSMDTRPPMIESSVPMNMGTKVSVISPISVFFDESLDPASVTSATVKLTYFANFPMPVLPNFVLTVPHGPIPASGFLQVKGTVSYDDAAKKVSFEPAAPLPYGFVFSLSLDVKDTAGLGFTGSVSFTTFVNSAVKQYFFNNTNGIPIQWLGNPTDMNGRQTKRVAGTAPGTDTIWFTADDPKNQRSDFRFDPDGRILDERYFGSGPDAIFDTNDDTISICVRYSFDAMKMMTERTYAATAGPDAMFCTPDDVPSVNSVYTYMGSTMTGFVYNNNAGTDGTWHTSDDRCAIYYDYQYDAMGNKSREIYRNCAADQLPRTADDTYNQYYAYEYDAAGNVTKRTYYYNPGTDNTWLTPDDTIGEVIRYNRNSDGIITEQLNSFAVGTDGMWATNDDPGQRTATTLDAKQLAEEITVYSAVGTDGMWGTADDVIANYQKLAYDALGNRTDSKTYLAGPDAMWRTPDDRIVQDFDFDLSH